MLFRSGDSKSLFAYVLIIKILKEALSTAHRMYTYIQGTEGPISNTLLAGRVQLESEPLQVGYPLNSFCPVQVDLDQT